MKIVLIQEPNSELEIQIKYPVMDEVVEKLIRQIQSTEPRIMGIYEEESQMLSLSEIYYVESVERKTFIYTEDKVYRCNKKTYQMAEEWKEYGFIQTGKATLVNMNKMLNVKVLWNSRLEATLQNGEKVIISRTFIKAVREWLDQEEMV